MKAIVERMTTRLGSAFSDPNPILVKELRATFRTALFVRFLYLCTGLVALVVLGVGAAVASGEVPPAEVGQVVFQLFMGAALLVLSLVAPGYASACVTSEREQQTWESLELSGMSPWRVVLGKFAACYASIALVLVALSPVVGIAFLFGGVSPWQVLVGFLSLLLVLAPAIAIGVAISARLASTRLAIVLATILYVPLAMAVTTMMTAFGEEARHSWGTSMEGPFFYAEALVIRSDEWDTWALVVGVPLYAYGMAVWFLLASAVAGVRPAAEDRARALKIWAVAMTLSSAAAGAVTVAAQTSRHDSEQMVLIVAVCAAALLLFYGFLFTNEPPLPPRPWEVKRAAQPVWKRALGILGPGAAGTLRFTVVNMFLSAIVIVGVASAVHYWLWPQRLRSEEVFAAVVLSFGAAIVASFLAALGSWLRIALRHGLAARVLTMSVFLALAILPFLVALVVNPDSLDDLEDRSPFPIRFSVLEPLMIAIQMVEGRHDEWAASGIVFPAATYGVFAIAFFALVELRVMSARRESEKRRARFVAEAPSESSAAPSPQPPPASGRGGAAGA